MNKLAFLVIVAAITLPACAADETFTIKDYLHHTWTNEFVSYQIDASAVPKNAILIGPGGKAVPVQISKLPGGKVEVAFIVEELPAGGEVTYTLTAGKAKPKRFDPSKAVDPVSGMSIKADTVFNAGTFTLTAGITIDADNVTVTGAGQGKTIIKVVANDPDGINVFRIADQKNITIEDITIDGQRSKQGPWKWGNARHWEGIYVTNSSHVTIRNVTIEHMGDNAINFQSGSMTDNHVLDVTVTDNGHLNTAHLGGGVWMTQCDDSSIERCTASFNAYHGLGGAANNFQILDSYAYGNLQGGFTLNGATNSLIDNCVADGNGNGANCYSATPNAANKISNCTLTNNRQNGIGILNLVTDPAGANILENNTISGSAASGAGIYSSGGDFHIIRNNKISNVAYGIFLNGVDDGVIENNMVDNAKIDGLRVEAREGGGYRNSLINNTVINTPIGINILASDTFVFGNRVSGSIQVSSGADTSGDENAADSTLNFNDDGVSGATYNFSSPLRYDFNGDLTVDDKDIDLLSAAIRSGTTDHKYDMDGLDDAGSHYGVTEHDKEYLVTKLIGKKVGAAGEPIGGSLVRSEGESLILDSGAAAVRVPKPGVKHFDTPIPLSQATAPLQAVRSASGLWVGSGRLAGEVGVKSVTTTLIADGPVYAEVRSDYELTAGRYTITVRVVRGQDVVLVSDEFDTTGDAVNKAYFEFSFNEGLNPSRVAAIAHWGTVPQNRKDLKSIDRFSHEMTLVDYALEFGADRRELSVMGYVPWWPDSVNSITLHGSDVAETLSFFPRRIGQWRNPMGSYLQVRTSGEVFLQLPLYIDQEWVRDGIDLTSPYNTGVLEESWPKTACRRKWALSFSTKDKVLQPGGRSSLAKDIVRYGTLPLNKIKDWTLEWDSSGVTYPRLYTTAEQLPALRKRVFANPQWTKDLGQYYNRPQSYLLTGDPNIGDGLLHNKKEGAWFNTWGALPGLRLYVSMLFDGWSYVGHYAPNQARPMIEFIRFDAAMAVAEATDAERAEMRSLAAFVANVVNDQDWHPTKAGWHLGNVNMPPRQEYHHAVAAAVLPNHPKAAEWAVRGLAEVKRNLDRMVRPSGAWRECPHYQMDAALFPMSQIAVALKLRGSYDFFAEEKFKKTTTFMVNILTPPCPRFEVKGKSVRLLPAYGNSAWEINPLFGWWAAMTKDDDPEFSKLMMWAWTQQGSPIYYKPSRFIIDPTLPAKQPDLKSAHFDGFGSVLRSGFPSSDETWMTFRHGDCIEHYDFGDQGSFMLYAKGSPLVVQFSSIYHPHFEGAWYYNRASVNHRLVTADDEVAKAIGDNYANFAMGTELWGDNEVENYPMYNKAFESFSSADYVRGEQFVRYQTVIGKNPTVKRPPNTHMLILDVPDYKRIRQVLFLKDADPAAPNYFLIRDDFPSDDPLPGEWNIWTLAKSVDLASTPAVVTGEYGVNLDVYMASPADPQWSTRQETHDFRLSLIPKSTKQPWSETLTNLRAKAPAGQGFLAVLYPRKADEQQPTFETIAGGKGVKVVTPRGTDWAFLAIEPFTWSGDGLSFSGTAGAIRKTGDVYEVIFMAPGEAIVAGETITATEAMQKAIPAK